MRFFSLDRIDSTNAYLLRFPEQDRVGTVVSAWEQTAGKGMADNQWESAPGMNLTFSMGVDMSFMKAAFPAFSKIFSHHGRDSMRLAYIVNDVLRVRGDEEMFSSGSLKSVKTVLDIEGEVRHHALEDARDAAHAYRKMIAMLDVA